MFKSLLSSKTNLCTPPFKATFSFTVIHLNRVFWLFIYFWSLWPLGPYDSIKIALAKGLVTSIQSSKQFSLFTDLTGVLGGPSHSSFPWNSFLKFSSALCMVLIYCSAFQYCSSLLIVRNRPFLDERPPVAAGGFSSLLQFTFELCLPLPPVSIFWALFQSVSNTFGGPSLGQALAWVPGMNKMESLPLEVGVGLETEVRG